MIYQLQHLPLWKEALKKFISTDPKPGDLIRNDWLMSEFGISQPETANDYVKSQLEFLQAFTSFKDALLEDYRIDLKPVRGVGYEVVHPKDQTRLALEKRTLNISRELRKMTRSIAFVNVEVLSESERREHTDGMTKAATIQNMFNRRRLLGR
jgi:hypothetical protein